MLHYCWGATEQNMINHEPNTEAALRELPQASCFRRSVELFGTCIAIHTHLHVSR